MGTPVTSAVRRPDREELVRYFSRSWGLLSLVIPWIVPPLVVLATEEVSYMSVPWACARQAPVALHVVPVVALIVIALCGMLARRDWARTGRGVEDEAATVLTRSRFLAILGLAASIFCALIVLAMWLPMFIVGPCLHS